MTCQKLVSKVGIRSLRNASGNLVSDQVLSSNMTTFVVTTSFKIDAEKIKEAKNLAQRFGVPYLERKKYSVRYLIGETAGALVVYKDKLVYVSRDGEELSFHPDTAMLRIKNSHDPLIDLLGSEPLRILDATMGLASDSILMAYHGHQLTGVEANPLIHLIVSQGLQTFETSDKRLENAMRGIEAQCADHFSLLKSLPDGEFDVVYFDPMFSQALTSSPSFQGLRELACQARLDEQVLAEARRVAKQKIILKAHFRDPIFEKLGFDRQVRPNSKFHYGVIEL
ncbi:class I SAM-dependent methyltransferase [Streptococcus merionis]|uniref:class I SAM-dependent methyltransferase n=1 Tax=Streptococcus merionis TaxID=400065 RepID=UPI0035145783